MEIVDCKKTKPLPIRGRAKKLPHRGREKLPLRRKRSGFKDKKFSGALQENILALLCFDTASCPLIIASVDVSLFESAVYRTIADRAIKYFKKYGKAPGDHLPDLLEDKLASKRAEARMYSEALHDLHELSQSIHRDFVLDQVATFVKKQSLRQTIVTMAESLQRDELEKTIAILRQGLQRAEISGSADPLNLAAAAHLYREFRKFEFPSAEFALYPVVPLPGIIQINGSRGDAKTWLGMYIGVAASAGVDLFGWSCPKPLKVLYIDAEQTPRATQCRLDDVVNHLNVRPSKVRKNFTVICTSEGLLSAPINLADDKQEDVLVEFFSQYDVVILDSISTLTFDSDLDKALGWEVINRVCMRTRDHETSVIRLQHLGKDKSRGGVGSHRQENPLNVCLTMKSQTPFTFHGDRVIRVSCTKIRDNAPSEFNTIDLKIANDELGRVVITHEPVRKNKTKTKTLAAEIAELMECGEWDSINKVDFADKHEVARSTLYKAIADAEDLRQAESLL